MLLRFFTIIYSCSSYFIVMQPFREIPQLCTIMHYYALVIQYWIAVMVLIWTDLILSSDKFILAICTKFQSNAVLYIGSDKNNIFCRYTLIQIILYSNWGLFIMITHSGYSFTIILVLHVKFHIKTALFIYSAILQNEISELHLSSLYLPLNQINSW